MIKTSVKFAVCFFLFLTSLFAIAQKLPAVQNVSLRAPANIKVDGKATEWDDKFQAYNRATEIYYSLANDKDNLYLLLSADKPEIINKILLGGVTLVIDTLNQKSDNGIVITFPTFYKNQRPNINLKNKPMLNNDTVLYQTQIDSFRRVINENLISNLKLIEIEGVKEIPDSLVSVYNDNHIKAAALFDRQLRYVSELALPIKYLNLNVHVNKFNYHIKLHGAMGNKSKIQMSKSGTFVLVSGANGTYAVPSGSQYLSYTYMTDFWGEYTLAKKP